MLHEVRSVLAIFVIGLLSVALSAAVMVSPSPSPSQAQQPGAQARPTGPNVLVLDPAHGGTDPGARGTGGMRESEIVLDFAV